MTSWLRHRGNQALLRQSAASQPLQNEVPLLQSTVIANIVFINIDWKDSRHATEKSTRRNLNLLANTIDDVVRKMRPAMICMVEVGVSHQPLTLPHMEQVRDQVLTTWRRRANENARIRIMFEVGHPYMTV